MDAIVKKVPKVLRKRLVFNYLAFARTFDFTDPKLAAEYEAWQAKRLQQEQEAETLCHA